MSNRYEGKTIDFSLESYVDKYKVKCVIGDKTETEKIKFYVNNKEYILNTGYKKNENVCKLYFEEKSIDNENVEYFYVDSFDIKILGITSATGSAKKTSRKKPKKTSKKKSKKKPKKTKK